MHAILQLSRILPKLNCNVGTVREQVSLSLDQDLASFMAPSVTVVQTDAAQLTSNQ